MSEIKTVDLLKEDVELIEIKIQELESIIKYNSEELAYFKDKLKLSRKYIEKLDQEFENQE